MAVLKRKYVDINDTLREIKTQIIDGLPYALKKCPRFSNPKQLFDWFNDRVNYKNDPKNIELLQCLPTLLTENNFHGRKGAGDCDCFTIGEITLMIAQNWDDINVVLAGRSLKCPVHIYAEIKWNGRWYTMDLTNKKFDKERFYKYTQRIPVRWQNWNI